MAPSNSSTPNTDGKAVVQDPPYYPKKQKKTCCIKNCVFNRYSNLLFQSDYPWYLDSPVPDIGLGRWTSQQTSPLLNLLPPEIKNMIFDLVLDRDSTVDSKGHIKVSSAANSRYCHCDDCDRTQDALLLSCRDVYRDVAGMPFSSQHPFRFEGCESFLKFMAQTSPRRQQGIQHLIISLDEPTDSLEELVTLLQALHQLPMLVRLEVEIRYDKVFESPKEKIPEMKLELGKLVRLEYFAIQILHDRVFLSNTVVRRRIIDFVKEMCRAAPCMRESEPEVKGYLIKDSEGD